MALIHPPKLQKRHFLREAFSSEEAERIDKKTVTAEENPEHSAYAGENTEDKVFVLSIREVEEYLPESYRKCRNTAYTASEYGGKYTSATVKDDLWWLRSPGYVLNDAAYVSDQGEIDISGSLATGYKGVRPAIWISLDH